MKNISPHWNIEYIKGLNIEQAPNPIIGFEPEANLNLDRYAGLVSAGVHRGLPDCFDLEILNHEFKWIDHKGYAIHRMLPGSILPLHRDKYSFYSNQYNITDFETIVRVIVFLEDHKLGHILQIEGTPVKEWKAGDYVYWTGKKAHMAANFGNHDRYTLQITGVVSHI